LQCNPQHSTVYTMRTTTVYPKSVKDPNGTLDILKKGSNNKKLGFKVTARKWTGKRLYSLTLTERATCPRSCHHWEDCYGNNMPFAHRFAVGDDSTGWTDLELRLQKEVAMLMKRHPQGIVIRLHVLGDFYSVNYVHVWEGLLLKYPELCVFGYTGRELSDPIGKAIQHLNQASQGRFVIRYSRSKDYDGENRYAASEDFNGVSFTCPEQTGKIDSCADCGACWIANKTVRFLSH